VEPQTNVLTINGVKKHSLRNFFTGVTGINFPEFTAVGMVDGEQFVHYDSNTREQRPKTEWIKKVVGDDAEYWDTETKILIHAHTHTYGPFHRPCVFWKAVGIHMEETHMDTGRINKKHIKC
uniref:MHC class I-like antigen recognition-like domain-containing protein n=1 Tax=Astyanax mexicanus TaxID=7994 RepID=A0A8B9J4V5_ASTMX